MLVIIPLLYLSASAASAQEPLEITTGRYILYVGRLAQPSPVDTITSNLTAASIPSKTIFKGHGVSWKRSIDSAEVDIYATEDLFWIGLAIDRVGATESFLVDLLKNGCPFFASEQVHVCELVLHTMLIQQPLGGLAVTTCAK